MLLFRDSRQVSHKSVADFHIPITLDKKLIWISFHCFLGCLANRHGYLNGYGRNRVPIKPFRTDWVHVQMLKTEYKSKFKKKSSLFQFLQSKSTSRRTSLTTPQVPRIGVERPVLGRGAVTKDKFDPAEWCARCTVSIGKSTVAHPWW